MVIGTKDDNLVIKEGLIYKEYNMDTNSFEKTTGIIAMDDRFL